MMTAAHPSNSTRLGSGAMFDAIARRYDLLNRLLSFGLDRGWRRATARALGLTAGARVLDLATGTADLAITVAERYPDAAVLGSDPSAQMLAQAANKVQLKGLHHRVTLQQGEAEALPFADHSFDAVTIAFGIRNVPNRLQALSQMRRVTRPGGRVAVLELSEPERGLLARLARWHLRVLVPRLGAWLSGAREYRYLERSVAAFPAPAGFEALMRQAGLRPLARRRFAFGACHLFLATPDVAPARIRPEDASA
ncbi:MAG: bifunctional demethylmenaquinone methyltransferase/2-methoxy-6-polyprenyl-1,4-benzoquinol methylase UbiE [Polyangiales bacterium]